jgi:uroporphyrinogen-III decarboxylase
MSNYPENWAKMTPAEKRQSRLNATLETSKMKFPSKDAEQAYLIKQKRLVDIYDLREPDRVPVNIPTGNLPLKMFGVTPYDVMYNPAKALEACAKFNAKYSKDLETTASPWAIPGRVLDLMEYKLYAYPGHGLAKDSNTTWQFVEGEYMTADEYDDLIRDPSDFWIRKYLPRAFGFLEPIRTFQPFTDITENVHISKFMPLALPEVQAMLQRMINIGKAFQEAQESQKQGGTNTVVGISGVTFAKAPFDILGDTLRGTTNIMKDMFRRPDKLLKALDIVADFQIGTILNSPNIEKLTLVTYPLHKGADGWMSKQQWDTFYWPSLKKVMDAFINEGLIQSMFAEGSFNTRLEFIDQFPKGSVIWYFDRTDIFKAKQILGKKYCLQGNVPSSLLVTGNPGDVKGYCRKLIQEVGKGGGFLLCAGSTPEYPKLENLYAMMEAVNEYGWYKKK